MTIFVKAGSQAKYGSAITIAKEQGMLAELWNNMMHSTPQGFVGVGLIGIYFVVIVSTAFYRIKKGEHLDHH